MIKVFHGFYARYFSEEEAIIFTVLLILFFAVMMTMGSVIAPLLWSLVIAYMLQGLVNWMDRLHVPHPFAVYGVYFLFLGLTILVMLFALPFTWNRISELVNDLPAITDELRSLMLLLPEKYPDVFSVEQVQQWMDEMQSEVLVYGQTLLSNSVASVTQVVTWIVYAVLVPILVFFMLKDSEKLLDWFEAWLPEERPIMAQVWHEMNDQLANYIRGKALQIVIVGAVTWLVFTLLGLNAAPVLAVLIGISVIIPFVGATVVIVPLFIAGFLQWGFSPELLQVMVAYLAIHLVDANILVPLIFSETVNLHPIAIIAAILVFGGLWGVWGVFFAIPLATFIKATIRAWPVSHRPAL
ncbi:MAG: AI-2E family transporter [Gammaproteobacteria bacterium]